MNPVQKLSQYITFEYLLQTFQALKQKEIILSDKAHQD